jgi:DNA-binding response OmpR family regulator
MANKMILLVGDDAGMRRALDAHLRAKGYDTCLASDAITSISAARKQQPSLVILDLALAGGDGFAVIERLKRHPSLSVIPIIVISARDASGNRERAMKAGAKVFLQEPVDNVELLAIIRQTLGEPGHAGDAAVTGRWKATA